MTLQSNPTPRHQQVDVRIISAWKQEQGSLLLQTFVIDIETKQSRRSQGWFLLAEMNGLSEGFDLRMLDIAHSINAIWNAASKMTSTHCWNMSADLAAAIGKGSTEK